MGFNVGVASRPGREPVDFTEAWLRDRLRNLAALRGRCEKLANTFEYGIVYVVRFCESDVKELQHGHGLIALKPISADRLVAKARVHFARKNQHMSNDAQNEGLFRAIQGDGVVGRVIRRGAAQERAGDGGADPVA